MAKKPTADAVQPALELGTGSPRERLEHFRELIAGGEVSDEQIAELAGVMVEDVHDYLDKLTAATPETAETAGPGSAPASTSTSPPGGESLAEWEARLRVRETQLREFEELLLERRRALDDREREFAARIAGQISSATPVPEDLVIRVTQAFNAHGPGPAGKTVQHRFGASLFRGAMAVKVMMYAKASGHERYIEILSGGG